MSKEKPEVGDIFLNKQSGRKTLVLCIKKHYQCLVEGGGLVVRYKSEFEKMTYLGKSKASIKELFDVKD